VLNYQDLKLIEGFSLTIIAGSISNNQARPL